jgi:cell division protein WhiA
VTFTQRVREELASLPLEEGDAALREIGGLLRVAGALRLAGGAAGATGSGAGAFGVVLRTSSGPVARRLRATLLRLGAAPEVEVHRPGGLHRNAGFVVRVAHTDAGVIRACGLLDAGGRPAPPERPRPGDPLSEVVAYTRGAVLGAGSVSDPRASAHLEVIAGTQETARHLAGLVEACGGGPAAVGRREGGWRVVVKSGAAIGALLAALGAHGCFLEWDELRMRRELRGEANRVANADRANLVRAVGASARHIAAIERLVADRGWDGIPDDLRDVALTRVANPEASLTELGALLDPPLAKGAVHRRLAALVALAAASDGDRGGGEGADGGEQTPV